MAHVSEEEGIEFPFILVEDDGTSRQISGEDARSFWKMVKETSDYLTERDGGGAWKQAVAELNRTVPGLALDHMGGYVPIQGYGTYQGEECYFRARHQHAALSVGTYDYDPADWLVRVVSRIPGCRKIDTLNGYVIRKEAAPWIAKPAIRIPGLRQKATVSGWNAKRKAEAQVCSDSDPHGAGYLTPAECVVIIREVLIPNLRLRTRGEGRAELKAYSDMINRMAARYGRKSGNVGKS